MLVQKLTEFIYDLRLKPVSAFDAHLLNEMEQVLNQYDPSLEINDELFDFICHIFAERWHEVCDKPYDYTINSVIENNDAWINLANQLSVDGKKNALHILIPVKNAYDSMSLKRLQSTKNLNLLFVSDDGEKIFTHEGILTRLVRKLPFEVIEEEKTLKARPISLLELFRIAFKCDGGLHTSSKQLWSILKDEYMHTWRKSGELPAQHLASLLEVIEFYFKEKNNEVDAGTFRKQLITWSRALLECPTRDVNHLYGKVVKFDGERRYYLCEFLVECLKPMPSNLEQKLKALVEWLHHCDASLISEREEFQPYYARAKVGKWLDRETIQKKLQALELSCDGSLRNSIHRLLARLEGTAEPMTDAQLLDAIAVIYGERWATIIGTEHDYTRLQSGENALWINLARDLSAAKWLSKDYYCLLMPTLTHDVDRFVTREPLSTFPLSHYILSESGTELILLDNCVSHYRANRTFYNCNSLPTVPLTPMELERIAYASPKFKWGIEKAKVVYDDPPLRSETVHALTELVNGSLYVSGLTELDGYSSSEIQRADVAYRNFQQFLDKMPADERNRLLGQNILLHSKWVTVREILNDVYEGALQLIAESKGERINFQDQQGCIAVAGKRITKLILEIAPEIRFRKDLEEHIDFKDMINAMREKSKRKGFREEHDQALIKSQTLLVSLLTYDFSKAVSTKTEISLGDFTNHIPTQVLFIFNGLKVLLESREYKNPLVIWNQVKDELVRLKKTYNSAWWGLFNKSDVLLVWLQSQILNDKDVPLLSNSVFYEPLYILDALLALEISVSEGGLLTQLINDILVYSLDTQKLILNNVQINLKLNQLINNVSAQTREIILDTLKESRKNLDQEVFKQIWRDQLIVRLDVVRQSGLGRDRNRTLSSSSGSRKNKDFLLDNASSAEFIETLIRSTLVLPEKMSSMVAEEGESIRYAIV